MIKLTKLSKRLEAEFPEEIQKVRKFYFENKEEALKKIFH